MNARVWLAGLLMVVLPSIALAQGRIAVVNLEQAILQTDVAQQRLQEFEDNEDFASEKSQIDAMRAELDQLVKEFQREKAERSEERRKSCARSANPSRLAFCCSSKRSFTPTWATTSRRKYRTR